MKFIQDRSVRTGIITGIISSLIVIVFLNPILTIGWNIINSIADNTVTKLSDTLYQNAAIGKRNWLDVIIISIIMIPIFVVATNEFTKNIKKIFTILIIDDNKESNIVSKPTEKKVPNKRKVNFILNAFFSVVVFLSLSFMIVSVYSDLQLNASFDQRINAISPYIDSQEEEVLKSQWACMKNRTDYLNINKKIDELAGNSGIEIPQPLLK